MPVFIAPLLQWGLRLVANAALVKGKDFIKDKTGIDLDKATLTDEDRTKLKQFELEHEEELLRIQLEDNKLSLEETKAYLADVADARQNQTAIQTSANAPWYAKAIQPALAIGTVVLTFVLFFVFVSWSGAVHPVLGNDGRPLLDASGGQRMEAVMNSTQKDLIVYILGVLSAIVTQIFSFYFGSSKGSEAKNDTLNQVLNRAVDGPGDRGGGK
jgi:hypothetical protein